MRRLIIDTDPGVDDAHAIMLASAHPQAKVEAITTVAGNVDVAQTTANACTILDTLEIPPDQTPIYAGCDRALLGTRVHASQVLELAGSHTRGQTTVDWFGLTDKDPHVHVVLQVDSDRFWELMRNAVS